jgi:hypothetical protein
VLLGGDDRARIRERVSLETIAVAVLSQIADP